MTPFATNLPARVEFGSGKLSVLSDWVAGKSVLLISDPGVKKIGLFDRAAELCRKTAKNVTEFHETPTEPSEDEAEAIGRRLAGVRADTVVAIGGGSVLDLSKVLAVLLEGGCTVTGMFEGKFPAGRSAKLFMVPTTAGTGSEATANAILYRPALKLKVGIVNPLYMADRVILDPELTVGLPPAITASTGLDALCHAIECLVSAKANPMSDMLATEALRLIFARLRTVYEDGANQDARADMLLASFYAGICIACAGTNIVHALSYPLGGRYRIPHGVSNAILLAPAMAFNVDVAEEKLAGLAGFLGGSPTGSRAERAAAVMAELEALTRDLGIPRKLPALGVPASDLDSLVEDAFKVRRLLDQNPKPVAKEDIRKIYQALF